GVARWDGQSWNPVGGASGSVRVDTLAVTPNGDLFAGGWFDTIAGTTAANIARFDGSAWSAVGAGCDGPVNRLQVLPNGDLLAIGTFQNAGTLPAAGIARWDGQSWSALPAGFTTPKYDIDLLPDGDLVISGYSTERIQRLSTTCPATAMPTGAGCAGAAGPLVLAADGLPWSGTTFRARATGFPSAAFAVALYGLQPASTPLANVLPQALPGCTLWTSTESIALLPVVAGAAETRLTLPNTMAFAGVQLFHQVLAAELDPVGNLVAFTGSNALALVLGTW
ncbi:MAG: hypothetical protein KDE27_07605, partial [Planctomycetes bacterium]|nr:hypothetical protein [Planctomycetota bacterium]